MALEIERKYLLKNDDWRPGAKGTEYRQGYLNNEKGRTVRVRLAGSTGYLTVKGPTTKGSRLEYEYEIPRSDALEMLEHLCITPVIKKIRYKLEYEGFLWEIDEFGGSNTGLVLAEIELDHIEQPFTPPPWIAQEVTDDPRYYNSNLARHPYSEW